MDSYIALTLFGCFFVLVFIGVPISFSIGIATVASMLLMFPLGYRGNHCFAATG